jgi:hypothetical protein
MLDKNIRNFPSPPPSPHWGEEKGEGARNSSKGWERRSGGLEDGKI